MTWESDVEFVCKFETVLESTPVLALADIAAWLDNLISDFGTSK